MQAKSALNNPDYAQFKGLDKTGKEQWAQSWSGKNIRELCALSSNELRLINYRTLFSTWSEQAHGAPGALVRGIISSVFPDRPYLHDEEAETEAVIAMSIVQFLELWKLLPQAPNLDEPVRSEWLIRLQMLTGHSPGRPRSADVRDEALKSNSVHRPSQGSPGSRRSGNRSYRLVSWRQLWVEVSFLLTKAHNALRSHPDTRNEGIRAMGKLQNSEYPRRKL
ncbi:hypothetical protein [Arthrobacter sp. Rue61a]|uniref:hypothetical protein n=1 Tax=Arthrobacter sp. Rue61a TaxID=1118963 RepID=UPI00027DF49C|nr:hypothetical protein [Arthrobacter sp. Rue61a]AFR31405.1 hypothetical protein ARUE_232p01970 [Arthrobacter sp. Rue61a]